MAKKKKKRGLEAWLFHGILTGIDLICEGIGYGAVEALRVLLWLVRMALLGLGKLAMIILKAAAWPFARLWRLICARNNRAWRCLKLTGEEFEDYVALILHDNGFREIEQTGASGDQGVDILATRNGKRYAIQCKNYEGAVGNFAVQEAFAGCQFYGCDVAAVVCPGVYTHAAKELAASTGVLLWDGTRLSHMMRVSGRRPRHRKNA